MIDADHTNVLPAAAQRFTFSAGPLEGGVGFVIAFLDRHRTPVAGAVLSPGDAVQLLCLMRDWVADIQDDLGGDRHA